MDHIFGTGDFRYEPVPGWGRMPEGWSLKEVAAVAVDSQDRVYAFSRGEHPICVFDRDGKFLTSWGEGLFSRAHGLHMGPDDSLWCTDDGDHTVRSPEGDIYVSDGYGNAAVHKYSPEGKHLFSWGRPGIEPGEFNLPHNIVCDDAGLVYVADRESHRIQIFDGKGQYQGQWTNVHRPC